MKALIISADNFEDSELLVPYYRLKEEGIAVDVASMKAGSIKGKHGYEVEVTKALKDVDAGALYEDAEVVVDNNLISSRQPSDLPAFMREIMKKLRGKKT